jgi:Preprotein translocase subunit YidC
LVCGRPTPSFCVIIITTFTIKALINKIYLNKDKKQGRREEVLEAENAEQYKYKPGDKDDVQQNY